MNRNKGVGYEPNYKDMKKSKKQRQLDLLDKLIDRLGTSKTDHTTDDVLWVQQRIAELHNTEGDIKGLSMDDMLHANVIWRKHPLTPEQYKKLQR